MRVIILINLSKIIIVRFIAETIQNSSGSILPIYKSNNEKLKKEANFLNFLNKKKNTLPDIEEAFVIIIN
jgi:hypothetical protein